METAPPVSSELPTAPLVSSMPPLAPSVPSVPPALLEEPPQPVPFLYVFGDVFIRYIIFRPQVFRSDSIGRSMIRVILVHVNEPLFLAGAFRFQSLAGSIAAKGYIFKGSDYSESSLTPVCVLSTTQNPVSNYKS